jgi:hypothetical protein
MPCPLLVGKDQKNCSASLNFVVLCIEELNKKCLTDEQFAHCHCIKHIEEEQ